MVVFAILTRLLPTKKLTSAISKWSITYCALLAPFLFSSTYARICIVFTDENAVSVAEKNADKTIKIKTQKIKIASLTPKVLAEINEKHGFI